MAEVLEIIKASETIRSHGLDLPTLSNSDSKEVGTQGDIDKTLNGNTQKQLGFLMQLLSQAGSRNSSSMECQPTNIQQTMSVQ